MKSDVFNKYVPIPLQNYCKRPVIYDPDIFDNRPWRPWKVYETPKHSNEVFFKLSITEFNPVLTSESFFKYSL